MSTTPKCRFHTIDAEWNTVQCDGSSGELDHGRRGLCADHYRIALARVNAGHTTWKEIDRQFPKDANQPVEKVVRMRRGMPINEYRKALRLVNAGRYTWSDFGPNGLLESVVRREKMQVAFPYLPSRYAQHVH